MNGKSLFVVFIFLTNLIYSVVLCTKFKFKICPEFNDDKSTLQAISENLNFTISFLELQEFKCPTAGDISIANLPLESREMYQVGENTSNSVAISQLGNKSKFIAELSQILTAYEDYLKIDEFFYKSDDFCILSLNQNAMAIKYCKTNCTDQNPCVKLCCPVNSVLDIKDENVRCTPSKVKWTPTLYKSPHDPLTSSEMDNVQIQYELVKITCPDKEVWYNRDLIKTNESEMIDERRFIRIMQNGQVKYLNVRRQWVYMEEEYCLAPIQGFNTTDQGYISEFTGAESDLVILLCFTNPVYENKNSNFYIISMYTCSIFHALTSIIYFLLLDRQNLHGFTVLSMTLSFFFLFVSLGTSYLVSDILFESEAQYFYSTICFLIAITSHFFFLSTFCWLTVINFDVFWNLRSKVPLSMRSKGYKQYAKYFAFACGLPLIVVNVGILLDKLYPNIDSEVPIPEYGQTNCFIAVWAQGYYVYYIIAVLIGFNVIFVTLTLLTIYKYQSETAMASKRKSQKIQNFRLFSRIFIIVGVTWIFEILSWWYSQEKTTAWYWLLADLINTLQSILLFLVFVCNREKINSLKQKYPSIQRLERRLTRSRGSVGELPNSPTPLTNLTTQTSLSTKQKNSKISFQQ